MTEAYITLIGIGVQTGLYLLGSYAIMLRNDTKYQTYTESLREDVDGLKAELKELARVITIQAVQTERLDNLSNRLTLLQNSLEDLRRGKGWITGNRTVIDGEYPK